MIGFTLDWVQLVSMISNIVIALGTLAAALVALRQATKANKRLKDERVKDDFTRAKENACRVDA